MTFGVKIFSAGFGFMITIFILVYGMIIKSYLRKIWKKKKPKEGGEK